MSYQPLPSPPSPPTPASGSRRGGALGRTLGILLIVGGLVGAVATYLAQDRAHRQAVENLQRGGSGLRTDFIFEREGTFTLYYEYAGEFEAEIDGDVERFRADAPDEPRRLEVRLLDADGDEVRLLRDVPDVAYDAAGHAGVVYKQVRIRDTGRYTLEVGAKSDDFAIAVGAGVVQPASPGLAAGIALAGVVLGVVVLLTLGRRRPPEVPAASTPGWPAATPGAPGPVGGWSSAPPPAPAGGTPPSPPAMPGWGAPPPAAPPPPPAAPPAPPASSWPPPPPAPPGS